MNNTTNNEKTLQKKVSKMSFEEAMTRLEEIVEILSSQKITLDSMIKIYEEGNLLKEHCSKRLDEAKLKIDIISSTPK